MTLISRAARRAGLTILLGVLASCGSTSSSADSGNPSADVGVDVAITDTGTDVAIFTDLGVDTAVDAGTDAAMDSAMDLGATDVASDTSVDTGPPPCSSNSQCATSTLGHVCDVATGTCVACVDGASCPSTSHCDPVSALCLSGCSGDPGCASSSADAGSSTLPYCNLATHSCVQCLSDAQCTIGMVCTGNACVLGCDSSHGCPGTQTCCGSACVDTSSNASDCGGCGMPCSVPNAVPACVSSACAVGSCMAPFADCDGMVSNGCETYTLTSADNCGTCGTVCPGTPNAVPSCAAGVCGYTCNAGYGDCDGMTTNGCETTTSNTVADCGSCGTVCAGAANATPSCTAGACGYTCNAGYADCDGMTSTGCEANILGDPANCGACGMVCGTGLICTAGVCGPTSCHALHVAAPALPSGIYTIDPDGAGPLASLPMYCDMVTNGGGWTLVQRTTNNWVMTQNLITSYATLRSTSIGSPTAGDDYRMAGINWPAIQSTNEHLTVQTPVRADGTSCLPMYYKATGGVWNFPAAGPATLTGTITQPVVIFNATTLSTTDTGPSTGCVNTDNGVPWTYASCCTTCPTFLGSYWSAVAGAERPMSSYLATTADLNGHLLAAVCAGDTSAPQLSSGYYGEATMEYYLR